jgi:tRNA G18 (ribose-2'-O)-methylase SpoU
MPSTDAGAAGLHYFTRLRDRDLAREGIMVAEGHLVAERLLAGPFEILAALVSPKDEAEWTERLAARPCPPGLAAPAPKPTVMDEAAMAEIAGYQFHRGVLVAARVPELPAFGTWWDSLATTTSPVDLPSRLVLCPDLNDAENLGVIYRCAAALGWDGLGVGPECTSPFSRRTLRVSMGNSLRLPGFKLAGRAEFRELKQRGFLVVGTSVRPGAMSLDQLRDELAELARVNPPDSPIRLALVFGNEFTGLDAEQEAACHRLATIPMHRGTDSLNVAVAAGIFMHELGPD